MIGMLQNTREASSVSLPLKGQGWPPERSESGRERKVLTPTRLPPIKSGVGDLPFQGEVDRAL